MTRLWVTVKRVSVCVTQLVSYRQWLWVTQFKTSPIQSIGPIASRNQCQSNRSVSEMNESFIHWMINDVSTHSRTQYWQWVSASRHWLSKSDSWLDSLWVWITGGPACVSNSLWLFSGRLLSDECSARKNALWQSSATWRETAWPGLQKPSNLASIWSTEDFM